MTELINKYLFNSTEEQKLYDVRAKLNIAKCIVSLCLGNEYNSTSIRNALLNRATRYFPRKLLTELVTKVNASEDWPKTFSDWIEQITTRASGGTENNNIHKDLRDTIIDYYLVKKCLPTRDDIVKVIVNVNPSYYRKISDIKKGIKTSGYKAKRLPRCTKTIIVEDPEQSLARMKYLKCIEQFRNAGAHIIYIEHKLTNKNGLILESLNYSYEDAILFNVAVSTSMGMISKKIEKVSDIFMPACEDAKYYLLTKWILDFVIPQVSVPSVFVLEDNLKTETDMPTMYSSKKIIMKWLELNDIPHNSNMHAAELFELIKRSRCNFFKKNVLEENLKYYDHKVLLRPCKTQYLNYFNILWDKVKFKPNSMKIELLNKFSNWEELEKAIIEIEQNTLKEDIEVHNTIEKILTIAKHERIPYDYIEKCDEFFDEITMEETVQVL
ncbi:uncharacterized protein LOC120634518 [Pararge aegeria]|uniref:uncharacterized protein LOC120634518 n=1 Tax=Pararge aegeria TaxID=116150 RepID=UPI0019D1AB54|nr:uncharacterized protein LOC120634518 [Pararge aegeria]